MDSWVTNVLMSDIANSVAVSEDKQMQSTHNDQNIKKYAVAYTLEGQAWCSGESCLTESPGRGFEAASPQILRGGEACLGFSLPQTPLMWEPPALGLPFY